ncbi:MAG TPA: GerMN domain-containing protein [Geobacteraceae bacterium]
MKRSTGPRRRMALLFVAFVICAAVLGTRIMRKYEMSRMKPAPPPQEQEAGALLVTLFFASPDGAGLVREAREIDACTDPAECAEEVMDELVNGPVGDMSPTLPPTATVHSVRLEGDTALVDFGKEFTEGLPTGSNAEMMAAYSVIDSLTFNFPRIKRVRFLVEGANIDSLGHLDLRAPLAPDFTLEKKQSNVPQSHEETPKH